MESIQASVGTKAKNNPADIRVVQGLLAKNLKRQAVGVPGVCDGLTIAAIEEFQRTTLHFKHPDGRVDPDGPTLRKLIEGAKVKVDYSRFRQALAFMYNEMIVNAQSGAVAELKRLNGPVPHLPFEPGSRAAEAGMMAGNKLQALLKWKALVKSGAVWDHKKRLRDDLKLQIPNDLHFPIEGDPEHEYYYDIWSNIHYGFVGVAAGFSEFELQLGAAMGGAAGTNDPIDVETVQIGIDLWNAHGLKMTADQLHQEILKRKDKLLQLQGTPEYIQAQSKGKDPNFKHITPITDGR